MRTHVERYLENRRGGLPPTVTLENVSRRGFLKDLGVGGGLVVAMQLLPSAAVRAFEPYATGGEAMEHGLVTDPSVFVSIAPDGTVTLVAHRSEMGTGVRTSIPLVIAEELEADWERVRVVQAEGDAPKYGNQNTDGSRSMRHHLQPARQMGAAVRQMLEATAAKRWGVSPSEVRAREHAVYRLDGSGNDAQETGERLGYGELSADAMGREVPGFDALRFKDEADFRYVGKGNTSIVDLFDITTGKAVFGADVVLDGMLYAVVAHPPALGDSVASYDDTAALEIAGVRQTVELPAIGSPVGFAPLGGIAVVADNTWAAIQGRDALEIEWQSGPNAGYDTSAFEQTLRKTASKPGTRLRTQGDPDATFADAARVIEAEYYQPHIVHAPMEPPVAVAHHQGDFIETWAPVQDPWGARQEVAGALKLEMDQVRVNVTLLGGGFGRKSKSDFLTEAALVSKAVGAPVKLQWTRADDIRHCFNAATTVQRIAAALDGDDKVIGWRHRSVGPTILSTFMPEPPPLGGFEAGMGLVDTPFEIPAMAFEAGAAPAHTRIGWFRAVANLPHAFAAQSFIAELAAELDRDPKDMLLELIGSDREIVPKQVGLAEDFWNYGEPYDAFPIDTARLKHVIEVAADNADWGRSLPDGEALGIAAHRSFVSYVANVVHVKIEKDGRIRVPEVFTAIDCGYCVNPERVRSQLEGSAVMGMTMALHSAVHFEGGVVQESNFDRYPMARIENYPKKVNVHIVEHPFSVHATGVGEPGLPPFAPALANAIFAASGKRLRDMPFGERVA